MDKSSYNKGSAALKNVLADFIGSYAERDKSVAFSDWFAGKLQQEIPDIAADLCKKLTGEIIGAVAGYDRTLNELNNAVDAGQSKEEWLAERMSEAYADMPMGDAGAGLLRIETALDASNERLMLETGEVSDNDVIVVEADSVEWNEYSIKDKVYNVGKQAVMCGLATAMGAIKDNMESGEVSEIGGVIGEALQNGMEKASSEVKAAVAGAVKAAAVNKLTDLLPADTPTETICDIACAAVENAGALYKVACGEITLTEALDRGGRVGVAVACRAGAKALKAELVAIPVIGPLVADLAGGLLKHMESPKFADGVYAVVRDAAKATWEGIKESGARIFNRLKNSAQKLLNS